MDHATKEAYELQKLVNDLSGIHRRHYIAGTDTRENDVEHSFTVALLCWHTYHKYQIDLDLEKIFKYALAHDFVERYAGDTNTYASSKERLAKIAKEKASLEQLAGEFATFDDLVDTMRAYENKADDEALFVWTVDKMQALIMGGLDNWRPYYEAGITNDAFAAKCAELLGQSSPLLKNSFECLIEYSKTTYNNLSS